MQPFALVFDFSALLVDNLIIEIAVSFICHICGLIYTLSHQRTLALGIKHLQQYFIYTDFNVLSITQTKFLMRFGLVLITAVKLKNLRDPICD